MEIALTGNVALIGSEDELDNQTSWDAIVQRNNEESGGLEYQNYFADLQAFSLLINEYILVKACLIKLSYKVDLELITFLKKKGYSINTKSTADYSESLNLAMRKSENLRNRFGLKQNELEETLKRQDGERLSFEQVMANLNFLIGFNVDDNITLARYNEYRKIIKAKQAAEEKAKASNYGD